MSVSPALPISWKSRRPERGSKTLAMPSQEETASWVPVVLRASAEARPPELSRSGGEWSLTPIVQMWPQKSSSTSTVPFVLVVALLTPHTAVVGVAKSRLAVARPVGTS